MAGQLDGVEIKESGIALVAAFLLFHAGFLALLFLVPLQSLLIRRGEQSYAAASLGLLILLAAFRGFDLWQNGGAAATAGLIMDEAFAFSAIAGLYMVCPRFFPRWRRLFVLGLVTAVFLTVSFPVLYHLMHLSSVEEAAAGYLQPLAETLRTGLEDAGSTAVMQQELTGSSLFRLLRRGVLSSYGGMYFLVLLSGWWGGILWAQRRKAPAARNIRKPEDFHLPEEAVWFFLLPLTAVVLQQVFRIQDGAGVPGPVLFISHNLLYIMGFLFAVTGVGVIRHWLQQGKGRRFLRFLPLVLLGMFLLWPINILVMAAIPLLGLADHWFQFRKEKGDKKDESNPE